MDCICPKMFSCAKRAIKIVVPPPPKKAHFHYPFYDFWLNIVVSIDLILAFFMQFSYNEYISNLAKFLLYPFPPPPSPLTFQPLPNILLKAVERPNMFICMKSHFLSGDQVNWDYYYDVTDRKL